MAQEEEELVKHASDCVHRVAVTGKAETFTLPNGQSVVIMPQSKKNAESSQPKKNW